MAMNRCMKCMREYEAGQRACPGCGNVHGQEKQPEFALRCGTVLRGRFFVGAVIGRSPFDITYMGWDILTGCKAVIRELFPEDEAFRRDPAADPTVTWNTDSSDRRRDELCSTYIKRARRVAMLGAIPRVAGVIDIFTENKTAYVISRFVEGECLTDRVRRTGPMDFAECVRLLTPVLRALSQMHMQCALHLDITPDNIMIDSRGDAWLMEADIAKERELKDWTKPVLWSANHYFWPAEMYMGPGRMGPWSDVYEMAATIYYAVTGCVPPSCAARMADDTFAQHPSLTQKQQAVLEAATCLSPRERISTMEEFLYQLSDAAGLHEGDETESPALAGRFRQLLTGFFGKNSRKK